MHGPRFLEKASNKGNYLHRVYLLEVGGPLSNLLRTSRVGRVLTEWDGSGSASLPVILIISWLNGSSALGVTAIGSSMASTYKFVTKDMIPKEWRFTEEQEKDWLRHVATEMPGETAETLQRMVAIELPDTHMAWAYQQAYMTASEQREDLVTPVITSREQWENRSEELTKVVKCLTEGTPPVVTLCAMVVRKK